MSVQYKAFISYRHHPEDIAVATQIHRLLERYHVPHELKKQGRQIGKIFRDKDELPTSSNLSDDIYTALENSEYLIVICSTRTKESIWIEREIEHFLKSHTRDRVLTVLVNGEPGDVIPEKLLFEIKTADGGEEETIPLEPLSCDWRGSKKEAVNRELPRLAAVLLGCSYDELVRRQQKYKARKIMSVSAAAFVVVFAVACYYIYSANQIRKSLNEALYNQAEYLASESIQSFEDGDRLKAVALALEAIGAGETERPYNPTAELALSQAVMPYGSSNSFVSVASFTPGENTLVYDFEISKDGKYLYTEDEKKNLTIFDTESRKKLASVNIGDYIDSFDALTENTVLVKVSSTLACYGIDGNEKWKKEKVSSYAPCKNGKKLITCTFDYSEDFKTVYYINVLNSETGEVLTEFEIPDDMRYPSVIRQEYADDGMIVLNSSKETDDTKQIYLCNTKTGDFSFLCQSDEYSVASTLTEDGKFIIMENDKDNYKYTGRLLDMITTSRLLYHIRCFDADTGRLLWKNDFVTYRDNGVQHIQATPDKSGIVCQAGSTIFVVDSESGEKIYENEAESAIVYLSADNESVRCLTENGKCFVAEYASPGLSSIPVDSNAFWIKAKRKQDIFALRRLNFCVLEYSQPDVDSQWEIPTDAYAALHIENGKIYSQSSEEYVTLDVGTKQLKSIDRNAGSYERFIGMSSDGIFWNLGEKEKSDASSSEVPFLFGYDCDTGKITEYEVKKPEDDNASTLNLSDDVYGVFDDCLVYIYEKNDYPNYELRIVKSDLNGENLTFNTVMEHDGDVSIYPKLIDCFDGFAYFYMEKKNWNNSDENEFLLVGIDISTGKYIILNRYRESMLASQILLSADDGSGRYAFVSDGVIKVGTAGNEASMELTVEDGTKLSKPVFGGDEIFALGDDKYIYRFRAKDGSFLSKAPLNNVYESYEGNLFSSDSKFTVQRTADGYLIADVFGMANVIRIDQWKVVATVSGFITYDEKSDSYICLDNNKYLSYKRLTREELIEMGKELVKDYHLTAKEKEEYGIG